MTTLTQPARTDKPVILPDTTCRYCGTSPAYSFNGHEMTIRCVSKACSHKPCITERTDNYGWGNLASMESATVERWNHTHGTVTPDILDSLKRDWCSDPIWDIETTAGFEPYRAELLAFRLKQEAEWKRREEAGHRARAESMGLTPDHPLYTYIRTLEQRLDRLEAQVFDN